MLLKQALFAAGLLSLSVGAAQAASITFGFDPTGNGAYTTGYDTIDPAAGNALAIDGNPSGGLSTDPTNPSLVRLLYQANLNSIYNSNNGPGGVPTFANGTGGDFFTFVAGFNEYAYVDAGGTARFSLAPGNSFLRMYSTNGTGSDLAGTGFATGASILEATLSTVVSGFFGQTGAEDDFDKVGTNNYPGVTTRVGSGSQDLSWKITGVDSDYLDLDLIGMMFNLSINTSLVDPFSVVNPSALFSSDGVTDGDFAHNIGTCNGCLQNVANLNFQFQADANGSISKVPEPGTLALLGLGFGIAAQLQRRNKRRGV